MMDVFGPKADALPARSDTHRRTPGSRERGAVPLALIVDPEILVRFRVVPARVSLHRNPSSADYLVLWERSEEHTSELQSHSDLVCRLLLEKKKENIKKYQRAHKNRDATRVTYK